MRPTRLLAPSRCLTCGKTLDVRDEGFCPDCSARAKPLGDLSLKQGRLHDVRALYSYSGALLPLLHRFKSFPNRDAARFFGVKMATVARDLAEAPYDAVVFVPRAERGYNQARALAKEVGRELHLPLLKNALRKKKGVRSQTRCTGRAMRLRNAARAYLPGQNTNLAGKRLLLVDDIFTTGATLEACSELLLKSGAQSVTGLVVGHRTEDESRNVPPLRFTLGGVPGTVVTPSPEAVRRAVQRAETHRARARQRHRWQKRLDTWFSQ